jgi:hypothetical protein
MDPDIQRDFPLLNDGNHKETSPIDFNYNCLAFALGDLKKWWEPPGQFGFYWPAGFPNDVSIPTVSSLIKLHGYTVEVPLNETPDTDAIAIYAEGSDWSHFAKYSGGVWMSKLGDGKDISHDRLEDLEGYYGKLVAILARPRITQEQS